MAFCFKCGELTDNNFCKECEKGESIPLEAILEVPSPFGDKSYEMRELHREGGYVYSFYEYEPLERNDDPHVHVKGHGREIEYYLTIPIREKARKPQNFPEGEESSIRRVVRKRREEFLRAWKEVEESGKK